MTFLEEFIVLNKDAQQVVMELNNTLEIEEIEELIKEGSDYIFLIDIRKLYIDIKRVDELIHNEVSFMQKRKIIIVQIVKEVRRRAKKIEETEDIFEYYLTIPKNGLVFIKGMVEEIEKKIVKKSSKNLN